MRECVERAHERPRQLVLARTLSGCRRTLLEELEPGEIERDVS